MTVDLHPEREIVNRVIFPDHQILLQFRVGHGHDYHRSPDGFSKNAFSLMFRLV